MWFLRKIEDSSPLSGSPAYYPGSLMLRTPTGSVRFSSRKKALEHLLVVFPYCELIESSEDIEHVRTHLVSWSCSDTKNGIIALVSKNGMSRFFTVYRAPKQEK